MKKNKTPKVKFEVKGTITVPEEENCIIKRRDWLRIKKLLSYDENGFDLIKTAYSALYGLCATALFTIIPISLAENLPNWVLPLYVCATLFSFTLATILIILEKKYFTRKYKRRKIISEEMTDIEKSW